MVAMHSPIGLYLAHMSLAPETQVDPASSAALQ